MKIKWKFWKKPLPESKFKVGEIVQYGPFKVKIKNVKQSQYPEKFYYHALPLNEEDKRCLDYLCKNGVIHISEYNLAKIKSKELL